MSRMTVPASAAARPKTSAHRNIAPVGCWNGGRPGMAKEKVPNPVSESSPTKISVPTPAASSPGSNTSPSMVPPRPVASMSRNAPAIGEPNRVLMAAKLPAAAITVAAVGGASRLARRTAMTPRVPPMAISGASGPRTTPEAQGGERGDDHAGQVDGLGAGAAGLETVGRRVAGGAGQVLDGGGDQQAGTGEQRQRPPDRRPVEAEAVRHGLEEPALQQADQLEVAVGDGGDRCPDDGGQGEEPEVTRLRMRAAGSVEGSGGAAGSGGGLAARYRPARPWSYVGRSTDRDLIESRVAGGPLRTRSHRSTPLAMSGPTSSVRL